MTLKNAASWKRIMMMMVGEWKGWEWNFWILVFVHCVFFFNTFDSLVIVIFAIIARFSLIQNVQKTAVYLLDRSDDTRYRYGKKQKENKSNETKDIEARRRKYDMVKKRRKAENSSDYVTDKRRRGEERTRELREKLKDLWMRNKVSSLISFCEKLANKNSQPLQFQLSANSVSSHYDFKLNSFHHFSLEAQKRRLTYNKNADREFYPTSHASSLVSRRSKHKTVKRTEKFLKQRKRQREIKNFSREPRKWNSK